MATSNCILQNHYLFVINSGLYSYLLQSA